MPYHVGIRGRREAAYWPGGRPQREPRGSGLHLGRAQLLIALFGFELFLGLGRSLSYGRQKSRDIEDLRNYSIALVTIRAHQYTAITQL